jgi:hypothetical protein
VVTIGSLHGKENGEGDKGENDTDCDDDDDDVETEEYGGNMQGL